jgi:hypothetical protein
VGNVPIELAAELRPRLGLERAVETGTYRGGGARRLAEVFAAVTTIELSEELHRQAVEGLAAVEAITPLLGDSRQVIPTLVDPGVPTLYWLDGHWSGGPTAGSEDECPVLGEIAAIGPGSPNDCVMIDDARLFIASPPPPHDPAQWPTLLQVFDALRAIRPDAHVTVVADAIIAVPREVKADVDRYARSVLAPEWENGGAGATPPDGFLARARRRLAAQRPSVRRSSSR